MFSIKRKILLNYLLLLADLHWMVETVTLKMTLKMTFYQSV